MKDPLTLLMERLGIIFPIFEQRGRLDSVVVVELPPQPSFTVKLSELNVEHRVHTAWAYRSVSGRRRTSTS